MSGLRSWLTISSSLRDSSQPETVILAGSSNSPAHPVDEHLLREQTARRSAAFLCLTSTKRPRNRMSDRPRNAKDAEKTAVYGCELASARAASAPTPSPAARTSVARRRCRRRRSERQRHEAPAAEDRREVQSAHERAEAADRERVHEVERVGGIADRHGGAGRQRRGVDCSGPRAAAATIRTGESPTRRGAQARSRRPDARRPAQGARSRRERVRMSGAHSPLPACGERVSAGTDRVDR